MTVAEAKRRKRARRAARARLWREHAVIARLRGSEWPVFCLKCVAQLGPAYDCPACGCVWLP